MLSCHVRIDEQPLAEGLEVIQRLGQALRERFGQASASRKRMAQS